MVDENMCQVMNDNRAEVFRDLRVASQGYVVEVHDKQVDVQLSVADEVEGQFIAPPIVKNLFVVGSDMPKVGAVGVILHLDRRNQIALGNEIIQSGGPAHEIGFGVFLPIVM